MTRMPNNHIGGKGRRAVVARSAPGHQAIRRMDLPYLLVLYTAAKSNTAAPPRRSSILELSVATPHYFRLVVVVGALEQLSHWIGTIV